MYKGIHVRCLLLLTYFNQNRIFSTIVHFHENPFSESRVVLCGRTERRADTQTETAKVIADFAILRTHLKPLCHVKVTYMQDRTRSTEYDPSVFLANVLI